METILILVMVAKSSHISLSSQQISYPTYESCIEAKKEIRKLNTDSYKFTYNADCILIKDI